MGRTPQLLGYSNINSPPIASPLHHRPVSARRTCVPELHAQTEQVIWTKKGVLCATFVGCTSEQATRSRAHVDTLRWNAFWKKYQQTHCKPSQLELRWGTPAPSVLCIIFASPRLTQKQRALYWYSYQWAKNKIWSYQTNALPYILAGRKNTKKDAAIWPFHVTVVGQVAKADSEFTNLREKWPPLADVTCSCQIMMLVAGWEFYLSNLIWVADLRTRIRSFFHCDAAIVIDLWASGLRFCWMALSLALISFNRLTIWDLQGLHNLLGLQASCYTPPSLPGKD